MSRPYLYNHTNNIDLGGPELVPYGFDSTTPRSKTLRTDMGPYPGSVPYLTDKIPYNDRSVNMTSGDTTNGRIQATFHTRTRDQKNINKYQFAWADVSNENKPKLLSLQQLNRMLALDDSIRYLKLHEIMDRFHLIGVMANNDTDVNDDVPMERLARTSTVTVWGATHVYDYWSSAERRLQPYDSCYFVIKKVKYEEGTTFQTDMTVRVHGKGELPPNTVSGYYWQVIPVASQQESLDSKHFTTYSNKSNKLVNIGTYWKVGHVHEYADIANSTVHSVRRNPMAVATDTTFMHMNNQAHVMQFYLQIKHPKIIGSLSLTHASYSIP